MQEQVWAPKLNCQSDFLSWCRAAVLMAGQSVYILACLTTVSIDYNLECHQLRILLKFKKFYLEYCQLWICVWHLNNQVWHLTIGVWRLNFWSVWPFQPRWTHQFIHRQGFVLSFISIVRTPDVPPINNPPNIILNNTMQNVCWCSKLLFVKNYCHTAAVSCNPNGYYLAGVQMGLGLTGEPGRAWCWCMGPCMGGCKVLP